jgi:hypothetical protein
MPSNFALLRHKALLRALGQALNSNVKQILRTVEIVSS